MFGDPLSGARYAVASAYDARARGALYVPPDGRPPIPCRLLERRPDAVTDTGPSTFLSPVGLFEFLVDELAAARFSPAKGGVLAVGEGWRKPAPADWSRATSYFLVRGPGRHRDPMRLVLLVEAAPMDPADRDAVALGASCTGLAVPTGDLQVELPTAHLRADAAGAALVGAALVQSRRLAASSIAVSGGVPWWIVARRIGAAAGGAGALVPSLRIGRRLAASVPGIGAAGAALSVPPLLRASIEAASVGAAALSVGRRLSAAPAASGGAAVGALVRRRLAASASGAGALVAAPLVGAGLFAAASGSSVLSGAAARHPLPHPETGRRRMGQPARRRHGGDVLPRPQHEASQEAGHPQGVQRRASGLAERRPAPLARLTKGL